MARRDGSQSKPHSSDIDAALATMNADELREIVRDMFLELDDRAHGRVVNNLVERAARNASAWTPASPSDDAVSEIISFAEAAKRTGWADPSEVDDYLRSVPTVL